MTALQKETEDVKEVRDEHTQTDTKSHQMNAGASASAESNQGNIITEHCIIFILA